VKVRLQDALHARPANLLVRVASRFAASIQIGKGGCFADARKILDVLALGAAKGEEIELRATGEGADEALAHLAELIARNFDSDFVPETGAVAVEGIAIGRALVVMLDQGEPSRERGSDEEETTYARSAIARVRQDMEALIHGLPPSEAELFEPERLILGELEPAILKQIAEGASAEEAVKVATDPATTDLLIDARARLFTALRGQHNAALARAIAEPSGHELVLVTDALAPSLVAFLPPRVRGIVAGLGEVADPSPVRGPGTHTSHAAILARGRDLPLAFVPSHVALAIGDDDLVVVDTTEAEARVWVAPSDALVADARARRETLAREREERETRAASMPLGVGVDLFVNVGSIDERVPPGAQGIGLLRTELVFAGRATPPTEAEQHAAVLAIACAARGGVVTARLFDAGGDKPLAWLTPPPESPDLRGIALLRNYPHVLEHQLHAIVRAAAHAKVRVLIPMTRSPEDVDAVRALARSLTIGAMIETPAAADAIDAIAAASDFICIGTNDLTALTLGVDRAVAANALDPRVLDLVRRVVEGAHARERRVTVCGEIAGDPRGAMILVGLGVDSLSVAPARVALLRLALRGVTEDECREAARAALAAG
jgi:phosphotransferase system HPr (HPr) family protein